VAGAVRRAAVLESVRTLSAVASEPVVLYSSQRLSINFYSGCWRYDRNMTLVGIAFALFPFADVVAAALPGIESDVSRLEWFDMTTNRSLYTRQYRHHKRQRQ
jgi:hypothetical protein